MPLEPYRRGPSWWVRGRIEYNGRAISEYYRCSTGASSEAGARDWIAAETERQIRGHLFGEDAQLTFADAVMLYPAKPAEAKYLLKILPELGDRLVRDISPQSVRDLGPRLYPASSTDTWRRQIIAPVSAAINHAHDQTGRCPPIRIKGYSAQQRIDQDAARGKQSRPQRKAGSWEWIRAVQPHANVWLSAGLEFMFETGCRIGQLVAIEPRHVDLQNRRVWVIAQKGHAAQWVTISVEMMVTLANLKPRKPHNRKTDERLKPRVFGYANRTGFSSALRTACAAAGVEYLSPHQAGRHGFYTELRVRQGLDPVTAAKAGRWAGTALPEKTYAHSEAEEAAMRAAIRTGAVHQAEPNAPIPLKSGKKP